MYIIIIAHLLRFGLSECVTMSKAAMIALSPAVQLSIAGDDSTVAATTSNVTDMLPLKTVYHLWTVIAPY